MPAQLSHSLSECLVVCDTQHGIVTQSNSSHCHKPRCLTVGIRVAAKVDLHVIVAWHLVLEIVAVFALSFLLRVCGEISRIITICSRRLRLMASSVTLALGAIAVIGTRASVGTYLLHTVSRQKPVLRCNKHICDMLPPPSGTLPNFSGPIASVGQRRRAFIDRHLLGILPICCPYPFGTHPSCLLSWPHVLPVCPRMPSQRHWPPSPLFLLNACTVTGDPNPVALSSETDSTERRSCHSGGGMPIGIQSVLRIRP